MAEEGAQRRDRDLERVVVRIAARGAGEHAARQLVDALGRVKRGLAEGDRNIRPDIPVGFPLRFGLATKHAALAPERHQRRTDGVQRLKQCAQPGRAPEVNEFQIGVAETYDAIVTPTEDKAFTLVGEAVDRSGMARATLAPRAGMVAVVPPLRPRPTATMKDMGMDMSSMGDMGGKKDGMAGMDMSKPMPGMDMSGSSSGAMPGMSMPQSRGVDPTSEQNRSATLGGVERMPPSMAGMDHSKMAGMSGSGDMAGMDMGAMKMRDFSYAPEVKKGPGVQTISPMPMDRTGEPGQGLEDVGHRVLVYKDLMALERNPDVRAPSRSLDIHLTGNMERFMWSFDGVKMSDTMEPFPFTEGERVRVNLINDTMMGHPIHIHGHFFELVTGHGDHAPRKHTVIVQPGGKVTWDFTADAVGDWAFHCHLLYHMMAGMMRTVSVRPKGGAA